MSNLENCYQEDEDECGSDNVDGIMDNFKAFKKKLVQFIKEATTNKTYQNFGRECLES